MSDKRPAPPAAKPDAARKGALKLLRAVMMEGQALWQAESRVAQLPAPDRARAQRLAAATLRRIGPADAVLAPLMKRPPAPEVALILYLAVTELSLGEAPHGVVNAAVTLARADRRSAGAAGMVNAVLRRLPADPLAGQAAQELPEWLRAPLADAWGIAAVEGIEAAHAQTPPVDLTVRSGCQPPPGAGSLPSGSFRMAPGQQISALPGYATGDWWVQDAAAAMAAPLLAAQPGEDVLDLCAAPGGKTLQLAATGATVTALDISEPRLARLRENLTRTGLKAHVIAADALKWQPGQQLDAILLDAPCSATGTIRRHPDLPFIKAEADLETLTALQAALIDRALGWLKPGGRLVFCTCSLLPEEGEAQLDAALSRHPGLSVIPPALPGIEPGWITAQGGLRLRPDYWPDRGGMDGFFMACLRKPA